VTTLSVTWDMNLHLIYLEVKKVRTLPPYFKTPLYANDSLDEK